jgi:hypothetical protein
LAITALSPRTFGFALSLSTVCLLVFTDGAGLGIHGFAMSVGGFLQSPKDFLAPFGFELSPVEAQKKFPFHRDPVFFWNRCYDQRARG